MSRLPTRVFSYWARPEPAKNCWPAPSTIAARKQRPLVKVNLAAVPSSLIESELFGHVKGAFTGAVTDKLGRFQLADGGTLFLDEIGELDLELQSKLLRVLQEGEFERIGSTDTLRVDVRHCGCH